VKKTHRVLLVDTSGRPQQQSSGSETRITKKYSTAKSPVEKAQCETRSPVQTMFGLTTKKKTTKVYVACPEGLEEGNTMIVISPDETHKFPVRVPKGVKSFEIFAVDLPKVEDEKENEIRDGCSFDYVCGAVDQYLDPTPRPTWNVAEEKKRDTDSDTEPDSFTSALDDFFTPTPEVKSVYRKDLP